MGIRSFPALVFARLMTRPKFDQDFWDQLWSKTVREHPDKLARRPPNAYLMTAAADLPPGHALDAGCGQGADTLWLAAHGWQVTAVDFSATALAHGRSMAEAAGSDIAERIEWIESDLATWAAEPGNYDLVVCLYVTSPAPCRIWWRGWRTSSHRGEPCACLGTDRSIRAPVRPQQRRVRCKSPSRRRSRRSIPVYGI